jgi:hypothetical protein
MIGRSLISAIAWITSRVKSFGTVLTPMIPVGLSELDRFHERGDRSPILSERFLKLSEITARSHNQPMNVEERIAGPRFRDVHSFEGHSLADQLGNSCSS